MSDTVKKDELEAVQTASVASEVETQEDEESLLSDTVKKDELEAVQTASVASEVETQEDEESLLIKFAKPFTFERKEYTEIDLSGLDDLCAADMIEVNKYMKRSSRGIDVLPEVSLEYACVLAAKACGQPVEFFLQLPPKEAIKVKNRVMGFLFGSE